MNGDIGALARLWSRHPVLWEPHVSGDGKWLAWTWTGIDETGNVWLAPTDGSATPARLTDGTDHFFCRGLSHDGGLLVLAQSRGSNEHDRLFLLDRHGKGDPRPLTAEQDDHYIFGGSITPDGRFVVFGADMEDGRAAPGLRIHRLDLTTGEDRILARATSVSEFPPRISPDGSWIVYGRRDRHSAGLQIWLVGIDGSGDREIFDAGDRLKARADWLGDGRLLVQAEAGTHERIGVLDPATGKLLWLIDDPAIAIEASIAGADGQSAMVIAYDRGGLAARHLDLTTGQLAPLSVPGASLLPIAALPGRAWIAEAYRSDAVHRLVRVDADGAITDLSRLAELGATFIRGKDFRWTSADGQAVQGWLYEPIAQSRGLVVWVHGGPTWHSEDWVNPIIQFLVNAGFTVLDPNYRGSTGFGRAFREAIKIDGWGGREQLDIRTGIEALIEADKAERGRIGVAGLSYGGYSSWFAITRFADLVDAVVPICGMYQLEIDFHQTGMPHGRDYSIEMMGGTPEDMPERYFNASPANFIDRIRGKIMIVHGLADTNVSPENTYLACRDLDRAGIPYELLTFPDEGHGIYKAGNRRVLLERMADFFQPGVHLAQELPRLHEFIYQAIDIRPAAMDRE